MNYYEAIKARSLYNVLKPDTEYYLRRIYRWYSKTFHTPLQDAFDIPIEYVLSEYFEEYFEEATEEEREDFVAEILETPEQKKARLANQEVEMQAEDDLLAISKKANEDALKTKLTKISEIANPVKMDKLPDQLKKLSETVKEVAEKIKEDMRTDPPNLSEIDMQFTSDEDFERMLNADSNVLSVNDPKDKKP